MCVGWAMNDALPGWNYVAVETKRVRDDRGSAGM